MLSNVATQLAKSISTSLLATSSVIVIAVFQALIFLNSKSTQVFCLNTHTQAVQTLEAVLVSQPQPQGKLPICTFFFQLPAALSSIIIKSVEAGVIFSVIVDISAATFLCIASTSVALQPANISIVDKALLVK